MFIDIHTHAYRIPIKLSAEGANKRLIFPCPERVLELWDNNNIERGVLLPLVSPEVYLPQSNEDILEMTAQFPDRFIPFCNIDPRAMTNSSDAPLGDLLRYYKDRGCKGIGEVMPNMPFLDPMVQNLFKCVEEVGFPLTFDISPRIEGGYYGLYDDPGLPQLNYCLGRYPNLRILGHGPAFWAEIGSLEKPCDRVGYPTYPIKEEGAVPKLLRKYPNLYGDLSAKSGYNALARDKNYAENFLNEFQDKLLFGTDICSPDWPIRLPEFLIDFRDTGKISEKVFKKIAKENAIRLLQL
jgi:uncharacterized protein